jgi:hypothetical protein
VYQVSGLKTPPDPIITIAKSYSGQSSTSTGAGNIAPVVDALQIPAGYQAQSATVIAGLAAMAANANAYNVSVTIGNQFIQWGEQLWAGSMPNSPQNGQNTQNVGSGTAFNVTLNGERSLLGVTVSAGVVMQFDVSIEVTCVMTNEAFAQWQLTTYSSIYQAYLALQSTYQQAVGQSQQSMAGANYPGSSPSENLRVMQIELKREVISLVTLNQYNPPPAAPAYSSTTTYPINAIVSYNNVTYISLQAGNLNNEPDINPSWWSTNIVQFNAPQAAAPYVSGTTYPAGAVVGYDGYAYISLQGSNQGNEPDTSPTWWAMDTATYVDVNLPPWAGQGNPSTPSALNFPVLFAQAPLIRFMEEAFEWDQMQYIFYPYYWNTKQKWFELALLEDPDPLFTQFLRAGAARVVVPVQPGFEEAFVYFLQTGQPWDGGSVPQVYDPLYLSIATEIAQADQEPVVDTLVGTTWTMRLPTTLTMLRSTTPSIAPYSATAAYPLGSVVTYSGISYIANQAVYEPTTAYSTGAVISYNNVAYVSLQNSNVGNEPDISQTWWQATPNVGKEPDTSPSWWSPHDSSLPSWTLDSNLQILESN